MLDDDDQHLNHLLIRATEPLPEIAEIRAAADSLLADLKLQSVDTVRNTIFPYETALDVPDPEQLTEEYLEMYPALKSLGSPRGTYFGRMIAYPRADGSFGNQLVATVEKLTAASTGQRWKSIYEINIYNEQKDTRQTRSFPCMSHLAFHVDGDRVATTSAWRSCRTTSLAGPASSPASWRSSSGVASSRSRRGIKRACARSPRSPTRRRSRRLRIGFDLRH